MKKFLLAGISLLVSGLPALAQTNDLGEVIVDPRFYEIGDIVIAKGTQRETIDQPEVIDAILSTAPEG